MSKTQILMKDMKTELTKLVKKYRDPRSSNIYQPLTLPDSTYLSIMLQNKKNRYSFLCCGWDRNTIELFINKDMIRPFLKTSYMKPILRKKGFTYARSLVRQYIWHEYGHSRSFASCSDSMHFSAPYTKQVPTPYFFAIFADFWADQQVKNHLQLFPGHYLYHKYYALKDVLRKHPLEGASLNRAYHPRDNNRYANLFYLLYHTPVFYIHQKWDLLASLFQAHRLDACQMLFYTLN